MDDFQSRIVIRFELGLGEDEFDHEHTSMASVSQSLPSRVAHYLAIEEYRRLPFASLAPHQRVLRKMLDER